MMVNEYLDAIFLAHTKVGSRDTYRELKNHGFWLLGKRHWNLADLRRQRDVWTGPAPLRNLDRFEALGGWEREWRFFVTVRHPVDHLLSHYCLVPYSGTQPIQERIPLRWVQNLHLAQPQYFPGPGRQWRFLYQDPAPWRVLKWETLQADLLGALQDLGLPATRLYHLNRGKNPDTATANKPPGPARRWWSEEAYQWYRRTYAEELALTGYDMP